MAIRSKTTRLRRDAEALKDDARDLTKEALAHPVVDTVVNAIRKRPVTSVVVTAVAVYLASRIVNHARHVEE